MNTFLPYPNFAESAKCLDRQRLGKQRVESLQLLKTVFTSTGGWRNHPAAKMWHGYAPALAAYGVTMCDEWINRGYKDTCRDKIRYLWAAVLIHKPYNITGWTGDVVTTQYEVPSWLGDPDLHSSYRSNLLRKDSVWYGQFGWTEPNDLPYIWPST